MHAIQTVETYQDECTLLLCESCYEIILEDDAEYHDELPYCHRCIKNQKP